MLFFALGQIAKKSVLKAALTMHTEDPFRLRVGTDDIFQPTLKHFCRGQLRHECLFSPLHGNKGIRNWPGWRDFKFVGIIESVVSAAGGLDGKPSNHDFIPRGRGSLGKDVAMVGVLNPLS